MTIFYDGWIRKRIGGDLCDLERSNTQIDKLLCGTKISPMKSADNRFTVKNSLVSIRIERKQVHNSNLTTQVASWVTLDCYSPHTWSIFNACLLKSPVT